MHVCLSKTAQKWCAEAVGCATGNTLKVVHASEEPRCCEAPLVFHLLVACEGVLLVTCVNVNCWRTQPKPSEHLCDIQGCTAFSSPYIWFCLHCSQEPSS